MGRDESLEKKRGNQRLPFGVDEVFSIPFLFSLLSDPP